MSAPRDDASFIETALHYASQEARGHVADALACHLHNDGYALGANSEANDVEWFARTLWADYANAVPARWDQTVPSHDEKEQWRGVARTVLRVLPDFQLRVAHRLITLSKVVRDIERAERKQRKAIR